MFHVSGSCLRIEIMIDTYCFVLKLDLFLWERTGKIIARRRAEGS